MKKKAVPEVEPVLSQGLRQFLYGTAAVTGGAIMIVEILGARLLAPYVGTSHFVWTAQIAVTLVALAAGYYAGGRLVDRSARLGRIYGSMVVAAVYLCLTVLVVEPVAYWCLRFRLALGALLASGFLFFLPLSLLAMVGPFFVRVITTNVGGVGGNVGRLTSISTLGSVVGTLLIGYVLIPFLPNPLTMYLTAALLIGLAAAYFLAWGRGGGTWWVWVALAGMGTGYAGVYRSQNVRFERVEELASRNSEFGLLQVFQEKEGPRRWYLNDYLTQNTYDILEKRSTSMFTYMLHGLAHAYTPEIKTALCIGLGVGIVPMQFVRENVRVDVVEINPAVVPLAREYFGCEPEKFRLIEGDGRFYVNQTDRRYDTVVLDAFLGDSSPSHLMTRESFAAMARLLEPAGTLVINCFGDFDPGRDFFVASLDKTLRSVFRNVRIHNDYNGGNVFFVASNQKKLEKLRSPDLSQVHPAARSGVWTAFHRELLTNPESGIVLTDAYNPLEYYDARNRERLRRELAFAVKRF